MYKGQTSRYVNEADKANGVVAYTADIKTCPITGKLTNCMYKNLAGKSVVAYNQEAANQIN